MQRAPQTKTVKVGGGGWGTGRRYSTVHVCEERGQWEHNVFDIFIHVTKKKL
jgi:hypothetical protein